MVAGSGAVGVWVETAGILVEEQAMGLVGVAGSGGKGLVGVVPCNQRSAAH